MKKIIFILFAVFLFQQFYQPASVKTCGSFLMIKISSM